MLSVAALDQEILLDESHSISWVLDGSDGWFQSSALSGPVFG
jgi:hypothetical protein